MATKLETAIIEMKSDLEHIKLTTDEIKSAVFGNGKSGLKARVTVVEVTLSGVVLSRRGCPCLRNQSLLGG